MSQSDDENYQEEINVKGVQKDDEDNDRRKKISHQYVHFATEQQCVDFIQYAKNLNYKVGHTCCSGLGCKIFDIDNRTSHTIKKEFLLSALHVVSNSDSD